MPMCVAIFVGDSLEVIIFYRSYMVTILGYDTWEDLIILDMVAFDGILRMNWLSLYYAVLDCFSKTNTLCMPSIPSIVWMGIDSHMSRGVILLLSALRFVGKRCIAYFANVHDTSADIPVF